MAGDERVKETSMGQPAEVLLQMNEAEGTRSLLLIYEAADRQWNVRLPLSHDQAIQLLRMLHGYCAALGIERVEPTEPNAPQ